MRPYFVDGGLLGQGGVSDEGDGSDGWHDEVVGATSIADGSGELKGVLTFDEVGVLEDQLLERTIAWDLEVDGGD